MTIHRTLVIAGIGCSCVVLALGVGLLFRDQPGSSSDVETPVRPQEASRGTNEDPNARREYALRRLRNPATGTIPPNVRMRERAFAKTLPEHRRKAASWQSRGPANVGGRSRAVAYDVSDPSGETILAGGVSGGMWRTTDGGATWTRTFDPGQHPSVTAIAQDPRSGREDVWYVTTGEFYYGNSAFGGGNAYYFGDGVYESTDGGQSWTLLSNTTGNETQFDRLFDYGYAVDVDPTAATSGDVGTDSEVYVATYGRIYRTLDGFASYDPVLTSYDGNSYSTRTHVEVTSTGRVYASLNSTSDLGGLYTSATGAAGSWTEITPAEWPSTTRTVIAANPSDEDEVWFLTKANGSGPNGHELWMYDAGTGTWTDSTEYLPTRGGQTGDFNSQEGYDLLLDVHPDNGDVLYVGGRNLWRLDVSASPSDANTWIGGYSYTGGADDYHPNASAPHHPDQHAIAFHPTDPDTMLTGSDGGVHRTNDNRDGGTGRGGDGAVTWIDKNNGYFTTQFYAVCQFPTVADQTESGLIMGGMQDNGTWASTPTTASSDWAEQYVGDGGYCALTNNATDSGHSRYVSYQGGEIVRFTFDQNHVASTGTNVTPSGASGELFINPYALDPSNRDVMYYPAGRNLWRNNDIENNPSSGWEEMTGATLSSGSITALGVSETNGPNVLYYGSDAGTVFRLESADDTATTAVPTEVTGADFPTATNYPAYVSSIAVDPTDSDNVMVVFSNYDVESLFYTSDGGASWTEVQGNLASETDGGLSPSVRSAAILPQTTDTTYYVGTSIGVYSTTALDGANTTWVQEGASTIGDVVVDQVEARTADGRVIVGTHANGTFSMTNAIPVELTSFDARVDGQSVRLTWRTASETNNSGFEVQHRRREGSFSALGFVDGAGTTPRPQTYEFAVSDGLEPGQHTFRLRQVDADGRATYSEKQTIEISPDGGYTLSTAAPNPFRTRTALQLTVAEPQPIEVDVYNAVGQHVRTLLNGKVRAHRTYDLQLDGSRLASGLYVIRVTGASFEATRKAILVR